MKRTKVVLLAVVFLAVCVGTCRPWGDDTGEETRSWADWAQDKFSKSFRAEEDTGKQATQNIKYQAEDAASRATDTVKSAASGASDYVSQKATDAKEAVSGAMAQGKEAYDGTAKVIKMPTESINNAKDTMGDTYEDAKQKMNTASDKASDKAANAYDQGKQKINVASEKFYDAKDEASDVYYEVKGTVVGDCGSGDMAFDAFELDDDVDDTKDNIGVKMEHAMDKVAETFDHAKNEVGEAYASAKNTMTQEAKAKYEAAKEKASDATGDLGAKMRNL